jgi:hypothetical protein
MTTTLATTADLMSTPLFSPPSVRLQYYLLLLYTLHRLYVRTERNVPLRTVLTTGVATGLAASRHQVQY